FVLAGLGACTAMTLRLYAEHKKLPLDRVSVTLRHNKIHAADCENCETEEGKIDRIERSIALDGQLDDAQRQRLLEVDDTGPMQIGPFWLSRHRRSRACALPIASLRVCLNRSTAGHFRRLWTRTTGMPTTNRSRVGIIWSHWCTRNWPASRACAPSRRALTPI